MRDRLRDSAEFDGGLRRRAGLIGAAMYVACGVIVALLGIFMAGRGTGLRWTLSALGLLSVAAGVGVFLVPWQRLPRRASLLIVPPGLALIGLGNWFDPDPYLAGLFFVLAAMWVGMAQPRGTMLLVSPVFALAYWWPIMSVPHAPGLERSVPFVWLSCIVAGETLSWVMRQLHEAQGRLRDHDERRFRALIAASSDTTAVLTADRDLRFVSASAEQVLHLPAEELTGLSMTTFIRENVHPEDADPLTAHLETLFARHGAEETLRFRVVRPSGTWCDVEGFGRNLLADDAVRGVLLNLRDVSQRVRLEQELIEQAFTDPLTGLPNRALMHDRIGQALRLAGRHGHSAGLLLIDLDRFKEVNDTLGHHYGDMVLRQVAQRFERAMRGSDSVARLGGDEFAVLLPEVVSIADVDAAAARLRAAIEAEFLVEGLTMDVDASIGLAIYPEHAGNADELLQRAEVAMYAAKAAHLDLATYDPELNRHSPRRLGLLGQVRRALTNREFVVFYQPKADARSGRVTGLEALVRWQHPEHGLIGPDEFIPLAEATGLIRPLTSYVLDSALRECQRWLAEGRDLSVAVNVSTRCLLDRKFPAEVADRLAECGVPAGRLVLEITESAIMADPGLALEVLDELHAAKVRLSIDDFGTGYSSMAYLKNLPVDELKVDRSFVTHMCRQHKGHTIVRSTVDLAHNLGLKVVAEGVEDDETWLALNLLGCDTIQGYHLARPMSATDLTAWLDASNRSTPAVVPAALC